MAQVPPVSSVPWIPITHPHVQSTSGFGAIAKHLNVTPVALLAIISVLGTLLLLTLAYGSWKIYRYRQHQLTLKRARSLSLVIEAATPIAVSFASPTLSQREKHRNKPGVRFFSPARTSSQFRISNFSTDSSNPSLDEADSESIPDTNTASRKVSYESFERSPDVPPTGVSMSGDWIGVFNAVPVDKAILTGLGSGIPDPVLGSTNGNNSQIEKDSQLNSNKSQKSSTEPVKGESPSKKARKTRTKNKPGMGSRRRKLGSRNDGNAKSRSNKENVPEAP